MGFMRWGMRVPTGRDRVWVQYVGGINSDWYSGDGRANFYSVQEQFIKPIQTKES